MRVGSTIRQMTAFVGRALSLYRRFWKWELVWLVYTILITLSMGFLANGANLVAGNQINVEEYLLYLLVGSLVWGYLATIFWEINNVVLVERWEDVIEYTFMAPVPRFVHLFSISIYGTIYSIVRTFVLLFVVAMVFSLDLGSVNLVGILVVLLSAALAFIGVGMMVSIFPLLSPEKGEMVGRITEAVVMLVSGIYYPITVLPSWMQILSKVSPARYALEGMRSAVLEGTSTGVLFMRYGLPLLVAGCLLVPLGFSLFRYAENYARRHGTLKRSG